MNIIKITAFSAIFVAFITLTTIREKKKERKAKDKPKTEQLKSLPKS